MLTVSTQTATPEGKARATPRSRKRGRMPGRLLGIAVILALLWSVYWFVAYSLAQSMVEEASATEIGPSRIVACDQRTFGGFPLRLTLQCSGATAAGEGMRATLVNVAAAAPLYRPGQMIADVRGPLQIEGQGFIANAAWDRADATVDAGLIGPIAATAAFTGLAVQVDEMPGVPIWSAQAQQWGTEIRPATGEADAIRLVLSAEDLIVTLGADIYPQLSGLATLTLLQSGDRLDRDPMEVVRTWLTAGGAFRVEHMYLTSGAVEAEVTGNMVLELDGTLSGTLDVRYTGEEDLPLLVEAVFPWVGNDADVVAEAIVAVSQPIQLRGEPALEVRLMIVHGLVKYGLFPIVTIPSVGSLAHLI